MSVNSRLLLVDGVSHLLLANGVNFLLLAQTNTEYVQPRGFATPQHSLSQTATGMVSY